MQTLNKNAVVIDLSYQFEGLIGDYSELFKIQAATSGHYPYLSEKVDLHIIRLIQNTSYTKIKGVNYYFFKGKNAKAWLPFRLHRFIKSIKPDVIIVHGFFNPLQVILLKMQTRTTIVIQYNGGGVPGGLTGFFQRCLRRLIKDYIFAAKSQAQEFIDHKLISKESAIHEIPEGSTHKKELDRLKARTVLNIEENKIMVLWVGRLDENKDPLTLLNGFDKVLKNGRELDLFMVFQEDKLLKKMQILINASAELKVHIKLIGEVAHEDLDRFYSAADIFVSASHSEGSGYALFEALSCGCLPVVTDIPSFRVMTNNGRLGALWEPGNDESFKNAIESVLKKDLNGGRLSSIDFFQKELSFEAIAVKQHRMIKTILLHRS